MLGIIYLIVNNINGKVYIGQTINTIEFRWRQHIRTAFNENSNSFNSHFYKAIRKYKPINFSIKELYEIERDSKEELKFELNNAEKYFIEQYDSFRFGYNSNKGGSGKARATIRTKFIGKDHKGSKPIYQLDKKDNIINNFSCAAEANRITKINSSHIREVCQGKRKTAGGFKWKYNNE